MILHGRNQGQGASFAHFYLNLQLTKGHHRIKIHFKDAKGELIKTIEGNPGDDVLSLAHEYDVDLEGACEGSIACSTCHVILSPEHFDLLEEPGDDENDMLDMAFGLTDLSRLGCQVKLSKELDGMTCTLPSATRNMFVDGVYISCSKVLNLTGPAREKIDASLTSQLLSCFRSGYIILHTKPSPSFNIIRYIAFPPLNAYAIGNALNPT